jgi:hypothetical protein
LLNASESGSLARSRFFQSRFTNLPIATFYFLFFLEISWARKAAGIDDCAFAFGFTGLKNLLGTAGSNNSIGAQRNRLIVEWLTLQLRPMSASIHRPHVEQWLPEVDGQPA